MSEDAAVTTVPVDTPALEVSPSVLEKLEPREYNAIRDAQEHEAKHPEPDEPEDTAKRKSSSSPKHKLGWQKRIDKVVARSGTRASRARKRQNGALLTWNRDFQAVAVANRKAHHAPKLPEASPYGIGLGTFRKQSKRRTMSPFRPNSQRPFIAPATRPTSSMRCRNPRNC